MWVCLFPASFYQRLLCRSRTPKKDCIEYMDHGRFCLSKSDVSFTKLLKTKKRKTHPNFDRLQFAIRVHAIENWHQARQRRSISFDDHRARVERRVVGDKVEDGRGAAPTKSRSGFELKEKDERAILWLDQDELEASEEVDKGSTGQRGESPFPAHFIAIRGLLEKKFCNRISRSEK
jgi:hypothetical protein